jgi:hypothetical protein
VSIPIAVDLPAPLGPRSQELAWTDLQIKSMDRLDSRPAGSELLGDAEQLGQDERLVMEKQVMVSLLRCCHAPRLVPWMLWQ